MAVALGLPKLLDKLPDRRVMLAGALLVPLGLLTGPLAATRCETLLALWFVLGAGYSLVQTPSGRLLRSSAREEDRPALFAAQFALSHACWLVTYPLAGWLGAKVGLNASFIALGVIAAAAVVLAQRMWPHDDPAELEHLHEGMDAGHAHLRNAPLAGDSRHSHAFVIDDEHRRWPS